MLRAKDFIDILVRTVLLFFIAVLFILFPAIFKGHWYVPTVVFFVAAFWWVTIFYRLVNRYSKMFKK